MFMLYIILELALNIATLLLRKKITGHVSMKEDN